MGEQTAKIHADARAERSRDLIMNALADVVAEQGVAGFSVQAVADRAGVAHRTVYRHYENRDGLLDGFARWLDERLVEAGGVQGVDDAGAMPRAGETTFRLFDELAPLVEALVIVSLGTRSHVDRRDERTEEFRRILVADGAVAHLSDEDAEAAMALVRTLASSNTWFQFRHQHGIGGARSGRVVAWALRTLIKELRLGGGPHMDARGRRDEEEDS